MTQTSEGIGVLRPATTHAIQPNLNVGSKLQSPGVESKTNLLEAFLAGNEAGATNPSSPPSTTPALAISVSQMTHEQLAAINFKIEAPHGVKVGRVELLPHVSCGVTVTAPQGSTIDVTLSVPSGNTNVPGVYQLAQVGSDNNLLPIPGASLTIKADGAAIFSPETLSITMISGNQLNIAIVQSVSSKPSRVPAVTASVKPGVEPIPPQHVTPPNDVSAAVQPSNVYVDPNSHVGSISGNGETYVGPGANIGTIQNYGGKVNINQTRLE